jgi:uncharacterized protein involved in outer membrane biogenesis
MRRAAIVVGAVLAVAIVAVLILWATFDVNKYRTPIQTQLQSWIGRPVTLGAMRLELFPLTFQVNDVAIADDPAFADPKPFVQAGEIDVSVKALPLLRGAVEATSLTLRRPVVELIKNQQGVWNFSSLGARPQPGSPQPGQTTQPQPGGGSVSLGLLSIQDGQLALTDRQAGQPRAVYSHIDVTLKDFSPDKPFSVQLAVRMPGQGNQEARLEGAGGPIPEGNLAATPFHGTLDLNAVGLAGLRQFLNTSALADTDGVITGKTIVDVSSGALSADGQISVEKARVKGLEIGYPITARYNLTDDLDADLLTVREGVIKLGASPLSLNGTIDLKRTPPELNLNVKADGVSLAEAARLASAYGVVFAPSTTVNGQVSASLQAHGSADKPALNGRLSARDVRITGKDIAQPVEIKSVDFAISPTDIRSDNFNITSGGTTVTSFVALHQYATESPTVDAELKAPHAQAPAILAMARAYGVKALDNVSGSGVLSLDMRLSGPVQSLKGDAVMRALNGESVINLNTVRLIGTNLSEEISKVAGFLKVPGKGKAFTDISKVTGKIAVRNGVARTDDLKAILDLGSIAVVGTADLVTQTLNLRVTAVAPAAVSQQVGGPAIAGFMKTALANDQGELVIPVLVTGTFQSPKISPDAQSFAMMKLRGLLPSSSNPASGVSRLVEGLLAPQTGAQPQTQKSQQKPAPDALQQLLESLSAKKKPEADQQKPSQDSTQQKPQK